MNKNTPKPSGKKIEDVVKAAPKRIEAFNPVLRERDMAREAINDNAFGSEYLGEPNA
jgi:hypothetical protein